MDEAETAADPRRRKNLRMALILVSIAVVIFIGFIARSALLSA